jgi:hypothetical protein
MLQHYYDSVAPIPWLFVDATLLVNASSATTPYLREVLNFFAWLIDVAAQHARGGVTIWNNSKLLEDAINTPNYSN